MGGHDGNGVAHLLRLGTSCDLAARHPTRVTAIAGSVAVVWDNNLYNFVRGVESLGSGKPLWDGRQDGRQTSFY